MQLFGFFDKTALVPLDMHLNALTDLFITKNRMTRLTLFAVGRNQLGPLPSSIR